MYKKNLSPVDLGNLPAQESSYKQALKMTKMDGSELACPINWSTV
jgi:hypothetical protein